MLLTIFSLYSQTFPSCTKLSPHNLQHVAPEHRAQKLVLKFQVQVRSRSTKRAPVVLVKVQHVLLTSPVVVLHTVQSLVSTHSAHLARWCVSLASALSDRNNAGRIVVVESWGFAAPSTKEALKSLAALGTSGRVMVVVTPNEEVAIKSFRNIPEVQITLIGELNAYDILCNDWIVFSKDSLPLTKESN
jgi:ribosomal protein L4